MKKKGIIIISTVVALLVVAVALAFISNSFSEKKEEKPKEDVIYKEPEIKELKLKSIQTKDKKVKIDETIAYFTPQNGISQVDLSINSKSSLYEMYLLIEFELNDKTETKIIYQQNVEANKKFKYILQSIEDLTQTKNWKVSQITESEAIANGFVKVEE